MKKTYRVAERDPNGQKIDFFGKEIKTNFQEIK